MGGCIRRQRPPPNDDDDYDREPVPELHAACRDGDESRALQLIQSGKDINELDHRERSPVWHASYYGHIPVLRLLIQSGAVASVDDYRIPRGHCCGPGSPQSQSHYKRARLTANQVQLLTMCGADVNMVDERGRSSLFWAVDYYDLDFVKMLVEGGADMNSPIHGERTLLDVAMHKPYTFRRGRDIRFRCGLPVLVLECGADVNAQCSPADLCYPIHLAFRVSDNREMLSDYIGLLVKHGADVNVIDGGGRTPLHLALDSQHPADPASQLFEAASENGFTWDY